jgi:acylphosphatase
MRRVELVVTGRVQGVMFRDSCRREATRLGAAGWVANDPDGSVRVVAEGDDAAVDALITWCRGGPPAARVEDVVVRETQPSGERGFEVR